MHQPENLCFSRSDDTVPHRPNPSMEVSPFGQDTDGGAKPQCPEIFLQSLMGRTGNSCMQFVNALGIAEKLGGATFTIKSELMHEDHKMRNIFDFSTDDIKFHVIWAVVEV